MNDKNFIPDTLQREVIEARGGIHLVLAPPGCGKTQILTERIRLAHDQMGVGYADMLCLTFTNRAARGMADRVTAHIGECAAREVYIGNVHRFCSRFLFANGIVPAESAVIDEDDSVSILARFFGDDEYVVQSSARILRTYNTVMHLESFMHQVSHAHPKALRQHPDCINSSDIAAMRRICELTAMDFDAKAMTDIFEHGDTYSNMLLDSDTLDFADRQIITPLLSKMSLACRYRDYKRANRLLDFRDLLLFTYDALVADEGQSLYRRYKWVQVDEVQDLNPLQLSIVSMLTARDSHTVMYLGDEQQAIFSFMGAKMSSLDALRSLPSCRLHRLAVNYRSPAYLLEVFNRYAREVLHISEDMLPRVSQGRHATATGGELGLLCSDSYAMEVCRCAEFAGELSASFTHDTTALVVNSNRDAEELGNELARRGIPHFNVSGDDMFMSDEVKLLFAHLAVLDNEFAFIAWSRLLKGLRVYESASAARSFVRALFDNAILPSDLLTGDGTTTTLQRFVSCCEEQTIVVFDTETTGLDVLEDDIVQIAAVKMRGGKVIDNTAFNVFLETDREIPAMLGDIVNPVIEERRHRQLLCQREALTMFMQYAEGCVLLAHNADFDCHILDSSLRRHLHGTALADSHPQCLDSLRLARLLHPELKEHKLKYLLAVLGLEGSNSHLADDDVYATCSLVAHCYELSLHYLPRQRAFLDRRGVRQRVDSLRHHYADLYGEARRRMYEPFDCALANACGGNLDSRGAQGRHTIEAHTALTAELVRFYDALVACSMIQPVDRLHYIIRFLEDKIVDSASFHTLAQQLAAHVMEMATLKEADLCGSGTLEERVFVTTIHKAKGLEFDNVIVFNAVDGRLPNYMARHNPEMYAEDARKFYVAMSRARRRLYVSYSLCREAYGSSADTRLTPFMDCIRDCFS